MKSIKEITIGDNVTNIGNSAFYDCDGLTTVNFGNNVASIGNSAFRDCDGLTTVNIGDNVTNIGNSAFYDCDGLTTVNFGNNVTSIGEQAFCSCSLLCFITIPSSVTDIGSLAFDGCPVTEVTTYRKTPLSISSVFHESVIKNCMLFVPTGSIELYKADTYWGKFKDIREIGDNTHKIGDVFTRLTKENIPMKFKVLNEKEAEVYGNNDTSTYTITKSINQTQPGIVTIPESVDGYNVTKIGNYAFWCCYELTSVIIPNSVKTIGSTAFRNCTILDSINIPNSITHILSAAFQECKELKTIAMGNGLEEIGPGAFEGCTGLQKVIVPDIAAWNGITFCGSSSNPLYFSGHIYKDNENEITDLVIPQGVTNINDYSFLGCSNIKSVSIPNSVTSIGDYAFYGCSNLKAIVIPNSVTTIGSEAFSGCDGITYVSIPKSVNELGGSFMCDNLKYVRVFWETPLFYGGNGWISVFTDSYKTLIVPKGTKSLYTTTMVWKDFFGEFIENGDIDNSMDINTTDVTGLYNMIFGTDTTTEPVIGDIDGSGGAPNTTDVTALYNIIFGTAK